MINYFRQDFCQNCSNNYETAKIAKLAVRVGEMANCLLVNHRTLSSNGWLYVSHIIVTNQSFKFDSTAV